MTKVLFSLLLIGIPLIAQAEMYQVGDVKLNCTTTNGVKITSKFQNSNQVTTQYLGAKKDFYINVNPGFFIWTWITLGQAHEIAAQGHHIFLAGNAPEGKETVLSGWMGKVVSVPALGLPAYPVGFVPHSLVTCRIYWRNVLN